MINLFDYLDYRKYIKAKFNYIKQTSKSFSFRIFNKRAGIQSSGFLKLVMDGKRNLARDGINKIAKGFQLNDQEIRYFENLVHFNQAKTHEKKDRYLKELTRSRKFVLAKPVTAAQYKMYTEWYYVAILELVRIESPEKKDNQWLQRHISPEVGLRQINKAVKDLLQMGLLEHLPNGSLERNECMLTTENEAASTFITNFHQVMSQIASEKVAHERANTREFSALTIATSQAGFELIKQEMQDFRRRLHSIIEQENTNSMDQVVHLNLQLFKLSK
jgi:uncharacterized protein (TIGR02147 family)